MKNIFIFVVIVIFIVFPAKAGPTLDDNQILKTFHRTPDRVPKYRFASITTSTHRKKRDLRPVEIEIDGIKTQLRLTQTEYDVMSPDIPVWGVEIDILYPPYRSWTKEDIKIDGIYYQDIENMATMYAYYDNRNIYYDGVFGEGSQARVVKSAFESWWHEKSKPSDHVIYDVEQYVQNTKPNSGNDTSAKFMDKPLEVMYPKLLIVLENNYFKQLGGNVDKAVRYINTFWNAVNLKYSKILEPKVQILVTGIIIEKEEYALRYIFDSRNLTSDEIELYSGKLIFYAGEYFSDEFHKEVDFKNYDSVITMTNLDTGVIVGRAWMGQICSKTLNHGFVSDDGDYSGLQVATHELGHLLSIPHDKLNNTEECNSYPDDETSTIMAPYRSSTRRFVWSECSKKILKEFAWNEQAKCMETTRRRE